MGGLHDGLSLLVTDARELPLPLPTRLPHHFLSVSLIQRHRETVVIYEPGRDFSLETDHAGTLISDFYLPNLWRFVRAAQTDPSIQEP